MWDASADTIASAVVRTRIRAGRLLAADRAEAVAKVERAILDASDEKDALRSIEVVLHIFAFRAARARFMEIVTEPREVAWRDGQQRWWRCRIGSIRPREAEPGISAAPVPWWNNGR